MATARKIAKIASIHLPKTSRAVKSKKRVIKGSKKVIADGARLVHEGKKLVTNLYKDGNSILQHASNDVKEYSDDMLRKVQKNPMTSVLVATGVGIVLSLLLSKRR